MNLTPSRAILGFMIFERLVEASRAGRARAQALLAQHRPAVQQIEDVEVERDIALAEVQPLLDATVEGAHDRQPEQRRPD